MSSDGSIWSPAGNENMICAIELVPILGLLTVSSFGRSVISWMILTTQLRASLDEWSLCLREKYRRPRYLISVTRFDRIVTVSWVYLKYVQVLVAASERNRWSSSTESTLDDFLQNDSPPFPFPTPKSTSEVKNSSPEKTRGDSCKANQKSNISPA